MRLAWACVLALGCGDNLVPPAPPDAGTSRIATGTHLVARPSVAGGITASGDVVFFDFDAEGHTVAKAIPVAGGDEITIAASAGTGKTDLRFEVHGDVVFVWADRGNRVGNLTIWSRAAGVVPVGPNVRPGRAAATADGAYVLYERDVGATSVNLAAGPIAGPHAIIDTANAGDNTCWQDTDLGAIGDRFVVRACPDGATAFALRSYAVDGSASVELSSSAVTAWYGAERTVWLDGAGEVHSALGDGTGAALLASGAAELRVSRDATTVASRGNDGSISTVAIDGSAPATPLVTSGAMALGAIAPDDHTVLYATTVDDRGAGFVQPYMDVRTSAGAVVVPDATSCPACMFDSFSADGRSIVVLDPIDNSQAVDAEGPIDVFRLDGTSVVSFGSTMFDAIATHPDRFLFLDAVRDTALLTGWRYGLTARGTAAADSTATLATDVESFALDRPRALAAYSLAASPDDDLAGVWVVGL